MKTLKNGLITGLLLQLAIGPVFFYIVNLTLQKTIFDGLAGVFAVTVVDYFYITLAILGIGRLLENKRVKKVFGVFSSVILFIFFTSLFTTKAVEYNYTKKELYVFGFGTGLATFLFMGTSVFLFSLVKGTVPVLLIQFLNIVVGCLLIGYGGIRLIKLCRN